MCGSRGIWLPHFLWAGLNRGKPHSHGPILRGNRSVLATAFGRYRGYTENRTCLKGAWSVTVYLDLAVILNFLVDFLLLMGTNRLAGHPLQGKRCALAAAAGAVYAGACLVPGLQGLGKMWVRLLVLGAMALMAYGFQRSTLQRGVLFVLLSMALGGIALGLQSRGFWSLAASAAGVCILCIVGFQGRAGGRSFVPVELQLGERTVHLTALQDTGNTLTDPITGKPVLVVDWQSAKKLTGLTREQLRHPVESMGLMPGLQLIPYQAVGQSGGMLLALRVPRVQIGTWKGSSLVAFAPDGLESGGTYQALTGGML